MVRVSANIEMLDALDVVGVTSELARVYGIDFYSVISRGRLHMGPGSAQANRIVISRGSGSLY